jgi:outer membrane lipoprotein carrier protein
MTMAHWLLVGRALFGLGVDGGIPAGGGTRDGGALSTKGGVTSSPVEGPARTPLAPEVKALVDKVQSFYERTHDFTADFRQDYTYAASRRSTSSSGTVTYKRSAQMRWEYSKPSPRTFVLVQDRAYMYDPQAKLLTRASINTNQLSASVTFLWGQGKLADEFSITQKPCVECETVTAAHPKATVLLELVPFEPDPRFKKVQLEVDLVTAQVVKSTVFDPDGSVNAIVFLNLKANAGVEDKAFKLSLPPGTQLQDFLVPDAGVK